MAPAGDASILDNETVNATTAEASTDATVSWGTAKHSRFRSIATGLTLAVVGLGSWRAVSVAPSFFSHFNATASAETLLFIIVLILVGGPFSLLYWLIAYEESTDAERQSLRNNLRVKQPDWSWVRPVWIGLGAIGTGICFWLLDGVTVSLYLLPSTLWMAVPLFTQEWSASYTVDPATGVIEIESGSRTKQRTFEWAVDVRRFSLGSWTLFVFSNRGKRWYEGLHLLPAPEAVATELESVVRQIVDQQDPPPRIPRDERIIIGGIGASMLGIGPFLYLLSGEPAVLLTTAGPSAIIAHGLLLHAARA